MQTTQNLEILLNLNWRLITQDDRLSLMSFRIWPCVRVRLKLKWNLAFFILAKGLPLLNASKFFFDKMNSFVQNFACQILTRTLPYSFVSKLAIFSRQKTALGYKVNLLALQLTRKNKVIILKQLILNIRMSWLSEGKIIRYHI